GLTGSGGGVQRLPDRGERGLGVKTEESAQAGGSARAEVGDVVDLVGVQADGVHQGDLHLVRGGDGADQLGAGGTGVLGDGEQRGDVVTGVGVVGGQVGVVEVQLADRHSVRPGGRLRADPQVAAAPEQGCSGG